MEVLYVLLVLLVVTRVFGELAARIGQPPLVGELVAGVVLGLALQQYSETFPVLAGLTEDDVFQALTDLGVFFLMLHAGVEMRPKELAEISANASFVALGGMAVPFAAGLGLGWIVLPESEYRAAQAIFIATALSITAVPVVVRALQDIRQQDSKMGRTIVSAAIIDDILSLVLLAVLTAIIRTGSLPNVGALGWIALQVIAFFAITLAVGVYVLPRAGKLIKKLWAEEFEFSGLLVVALAAAVLAEALQLHFIVGAFMAGLFFGRRTMGAKAYHAVRERISGMTTGFLGPIFFASIGLHLHLSAVATIPGVLTALIVLALAAKLVGAGVPAYLTGLGPREAIGVGVGMSARGAVELIIADIALRKGLFDKPQPPPPVVAELFSAIVIVAIVTTAIAPIGLQLLFRNSGTANR